MPLSSLLCCPQVENECVGAPCGIMDQMAATLGKKSELLTLVCQPAELQSPVAIPINVRFWGLDSGGLRSNSANDQRIWYDPPFDVKTDVLRTLVGCYRGAA